MTERVLRFIREQAEELDLEGPVVEFGSLQTEGQEGFADIRKFFPGLEFVGCDIRPGPGVDLVDDMEKSHFPTSSVGTVVCLETLEHVRQPWVAVEEAYRILRPGGTFIVSVPFRHHIHEHPDDYWRVTARGLEILMTRAGFEDILTWDSGEELMESIPFPFLSLGVARKPLSECGRLLFDGGLAVEKMDGYRATAATRDRTCSKPRGPRPVIPILVPLFGREKEARMMFEQLERVTDNYSLILVDNGFEDAGLIEILEPDTYIRNEDNVGVVGAINQGLERCESPYVGVLHSDAVIFEEGWLDHIIDFMERRPDVGLVGLCGRHSIREDGSLDLETTVLKQERFPRSMNPTWRFTEVATIDGMGFVMRNAGFKLDEFIGFMHCYDLDLSMQYIEAGYRVYVAGIDCWHLAGFGAESSRGDEKYLAEVGGDDGAYYEEVRERFRRKWQHLLPITRGYRDEAYASNRLRELLLRSEEAEANYVKAVAEVDRTRQEVERRGIEIEKAAVYFEQLENIARERDAYAHRLEAELDQARASRQATPGASGAGSPSPAGNIGKIRHYLSSEGAASTVRRGVAHAVRKLRG